MEDFNQLYGLYPERKYERDTYSNMARDLAQLAGLEAYRSLCAASCSAPQSLTPTCT
jgi:hypothetical protein